VFDLKDQPSSGASAKSAKAAPPAKSLAELEREQQLAEQQRREAAKAKAVQIEDELAALKKRLGR
jgi:hypothetical protein